MEFISAGEIAKRNASKRGSRSANFNGISISQVYYNERTQPSRIMTIRIDGELLSKARINKGDKVDVRFSEDGKTWKLKLVDYNDNNGYKISTSTKIAKTGVIRFTWYKGMPLFGESEKVKKAKVMVLNKDITVSIGDITFILPQISFIEFLPDDKE